MKTEFSEDIPPSSSQQSQVLESSQHGLPDDKKSINNLSETDTKAHMAVDLCDDEDLDQGDLDMSGISNKVWLVKVPKFLADYWSSVEEDNQTIGWVRVGQQQGSPEQKIKVILPDAVARRKQLPQEYNLSVMNKYPADTYLFEETVQERPGKGAVLKKAALTGKIAHECSVTPVIDDAYRNVMSFRSRFANIVKRSIKLIDDRGGNLYPGSAPRRSMPSFVRNQKARSGNESKNSRLPRSELLDALFRCFEMYEYWSTKGLREYLKQPESYLKEVLEKIAVLQRRGPYDSKWCLKPEYKSGLARAELQMDTDPTSPPNTEPNSAVGDGDDETELLTDTNDDDDDDAEMIDVPDTFEDIKIE